MIANSFAATATNECETLVNQGADKKLLSGFYINFA